MTNKVERVLSQAVEFEKTATDSLITEAKKKGKKKLNPKDKDHNKETAKTKKPGAAKKSSYYDGLLTKFGQGAPKDMEYANNLTSSRLQSIQAVNSRGNLTPDQVKEYVNGYLQQAFNDFQGNMITGDQYSQLVQAGQAKMTQPAPAATNAPAAPAAKPTTKPVAHKPIPYREDVWRAQRRLQRPPFNVPGLVADGKLGPQTRAALKTYKTHVGLPSLEDELAIKALKDLPEEASPETAKPKEQTPSEKSNLYSVDEVYPEAKPPTKTWGV